MKFILYKDKKSEWRWRLVAANNRIIADSAEGYHNKKDCTHGIVLLLEALLDTKKRRASRKKAKKCKGARS